MKRNKLESSFQIPYTNSMKNKNNVKLKLKKKTIKAMELWMDRVDPKDWTDKKKPTLEEFQSAIIDYAVFTLTNKHNDIYNA